MHWGSDEELFDTLRRDLFTAVVGDVMDTMGLLRQFLPPHIKPLHDDMVVIGRAMTVLEADVFVEAHSSSATDFMSEPFGLMFRALDDLKAQEVYVCGGASPRGKVIDFRVPLEIGGVRVMPGDIVFGDVDGVCVIPRAAEDEVFRKALEKVQKENLVGRAIEDGMSAQEAFKKFGVM